MTAAPLTPPWPGDPHPGQGQAPRVIGLDAKVWSESVPRRFWRKVSGSDVDNCWVWTAYRDQNGYGRFNIQRRMDMAHRVAYRLLIGEIPIGLELDHLCQNRGCVNPWHLDPVTHAVNSRRSSAGQVNRSRQIAVTACPQGHAYDDANTHIRSNGARRCRACERTAAAERYAADPEKSRAASRRYRARKRGESA